MHSTVQRHNRFPSAGRSGNPGRTIEVFLDKLALRRMQKHGPALPWIVEGKGKLLDVLHHAEATQRVWVLERIRAHWHWLGQRRLNAGRQIQ
jgi:hypothetical protein